MAPKKAAEVPVVAAPPPDPEVISEQEKLEKWNQRVQALQKKLEEAVRYTSNVEAKQKQLEQQLAALFDQATEVAANKKVAAPSVVAAAAAPPSKPPKGPKAAEVPPPPPEPLPSPREQEEEQRKRTKITNALMGLYKKKRSAPLHAVAATGGAAVGGGGALTPRGTSEGVIDASPADSPRSPTSNAAGGEFFPKPNDVPSELWATMLGLREERLQVEAQIANAKTCLVQGTLHLKQLQSMQNVVRYAVVGSEGGLKRATIKCEERHLREQAAMRESVAQASPPPPAAKKK